MVLEHLQLYTAQRVLEGARMFWILLILTARHSTAHHSTLTDYFLQSVHSIAQHSTARHGIAQQAQHSTAYTALPDLRYVILRRKVAAVIASTNGASGPEMVSTGSCVWC